jgi:PTS system mannose-specific IIA component
MVGALVVTHGNLALELVKAAKKIVGEALRLQAVVIDWDDDVSLARATIRESMKQVDTGHGVLIFTDMFGGTPTNISLTFLDPGRAEIVTGINLPMLIKFLNLRDEEDLASVVEQICTKGRRSIQVASELLRRHESRAGKD